MSAPVPLLATVISAVICWPLITLDGVMASEAVKSPITTVFDDTDADFAVPDEFAALEVK